MPYTSTRGRHMRLQTDFVFYRRLGEKCLSAGSGKRFGWSWIRFYNSWSYVSQRIIWTQSLALTATHQPTRGYTLFPRNRRCPGVTCQSLGLFEWGLSNHSSRQQLPATSWGIRIFPAWLMVTKLLLVSRPHWAGWITNKESKTMFMSAF